MVSKFIRSRAQYREQSSVAQSSPEPVSNILWLNTFKAVLLPDRYHYFRFIDCEMCIDSIRSANDLLSFDLSFSISEKNNQAEASLTLSGEQIALITNIVEGRQVIAPRPGILSPRLSR